VQRPQNVLDQQVRPVEEGVMPGDVVGVHDCRGGNDRAQPFSKQRFPRATAPIDRYHARTSDNSGHRVP
jgi:hypothetical protein